MEDPPKNERHGRRDGVIPNILPPSRWIQSGWGQKTIGILLGQGAIG